MNFQVVGCSHHDTSIALRERLSFRPEQAEEALDHWRRVFKKTEAVLLSTCNRVEIYAAGEAAVAPSREQVAGFLARFHRLDPAEVSPHLYHLRGRGGRAAPFHRGRQPRQHGGGRAADSRPGEAGVPGGRAARQRRTAAARGLSGGHPRRPPRRRGDRHPPAAGERSQRRRGRFRPANLRALRRQEDARRRRRRNGRGNAPLPARRGRHGHHRGQPAVRTRR